MTKEAFTIEVTKPMIQLLTPMPWIRDFVPFIESRYRTCYKSEAKSGKTQTPDEFIAGKLKCSPPHESPLEHLSLSIKIIGDRSMSHQLVRHRLAAYSQESQRYVKYNKRGYQVICPPSISIPRGEYKWLNKDFFEAPERSGWDSYAAEAITKQRWMSWLEGVYHAFRGYEELVQMDIPAEDARSLLPNATKTEVDTTFNLRQWRHVFLERALNPRAQWQIRYIMQGILICFAKLLPTIFGDQKAYLDVHPDLDPIPAIDYFGDFKFNETVCQVGDR